MDTEIITADVYESCYYILGGAKLETIKGIPLNGKINCRLHFSSKNIGELQAQYFAGTAEVNLFQFRRTYAQVCAWIAQARRQLKNQLNQQSKTNFDVEVLKEEDVV